MNKYLILSALMFFSAAHADLNKRITELKPSKSNSVATQFQTEVLNAKQPVVVLFSAPWCGPCQQFKPSYEQIALSYKPEALKFVYVNVDNFPEHRTTYGVRGVPTIKYFKDGKDLGASQTDRSPKNIKNEIKTKLGVGC